MDVIWMSDASIVIYLINRKPGFDRVAKLISGRSPGEVRISPITVAELRCGVERSSSPKANHFTINELLDLLQTDDFPTAPAADFGEIRTFELDRLQSGPDRSD